MSRARAWLLRLFGTFDKTRRDRELQDEIACHLEMHVEDNLRLGLSQEEARRQALIRLGGIESTKEAYRDQRGLPWLDTSLQDLRYGLRVLARTPGFTAVAVLTLALGIGIDAGIFTILNAAAFRPLRVQGSEQLVSLFQTLAESPRLVHRNTYGDPSRASYSEYREYRDSSHVFSGLIAYAPSVTATLGGESPRPALGTLVSCNYFDVLRAGPTLGRGFVDSDCATPGEGARVVLSDDLWRTSFGADASVLGRAITINRAPFTVVGVAPAGFRGTEAVSAAFWAPLTMQRTLVRDADLLEDDHSAWLVLLGRMKDGFSLDQARADLAVIAARIDQNQPGRLTTLRVQKATLAGAPEVRSMVLGVGALILVAVGLVLVIACANIANLLLARGARRQKEIAVRLALGASRARLVRQLLTESLLLASVGGALGSLLAFWSSAVAVRWIQSRLPPGVSPFTLDVSPDLRVLGYALLLTLITGTAFGLAPALRASRADLNLAMKDAGAQPEARRPRDGFLRQGLVATQVAVCMILLLVSGLLMRGLKRAQTIDPGFEMRNVAVASFDLSAAGYSRERADLFRRRLIERVSGSPGVDAVAETSSAPLSNSHFGDLFSVPGLERGVPVEFNHASPGYFSLLGIPMVRGRNFTDLEGRTGARVAIVTESTARRFWPGQDPVGKTIRKGALRPDAEDLEVVGVARDAQVSHLAQSDSPYVYLPAGPGERPGLQLLAHGASGYEAAATGARRAVHELDPELAVSVGRLEDNLDYFRFPGRVLTVLSGALGALALLLASMGVYGLVSFGVSRRVREIGIRVALGAERHDVTALVLREAMRPVAVGVVIGVLCCAGTSSLLSSVLYGISPRDPVSFLLVPGFLLAIALLAGYLPARRAAKVDPMVALRRD